MHLYIYIEVIGQHGDLLHEFVDQDPPLELGGGLPRAIDIEGRQYGHDVVELICDLCTHGQHENCPHKLGTGRKFRKWSEELVFLCLCPRHSSCPLGGQKSVAPDLWAYDCICGSATTLERRRREHPRP